MSQKNSVAANRREQLKVQQEAAAKAARRNKMIGIGAGLVALVLAIVLVVVVVQSMNPGSTSATKPPHATSDGTGITIHADKAKAGAPDVQLFADYQCPGCAQFDDVFGPKLEALAQSGDIKLTIRPRTFIDVNVKNTSSEDATRAAACADIVGAFPAYHLVVFKNQPSKEGQGYTTAQLRDDFPTQAGITGDNLTQFKECFNSGATDGFVTAAASANDAYVYARATETGGDSKWASTPTLSVNGKRLDNSKLSLSDPDGITALIKALAAS